METRVASPSDQNRTELTLVAGTGAMGAADTTPESSANIDAARLALLRRSRSKVQSAILIDKLLQFGVPLLRRGSTDFRPWNRVCHGFFFFGCFGVTVALAYALDVL